jgi:hypothetical protein
MKQIEKVSKGSEEAMPARIERIEEILRAAADFEPETEATYNFAAAAMARRRFRSRTAWLTVAGCACSAIFVWWLVPRIVENPVFVHPVSVEAPADNALLVEDEGPSGESVNAHLRIPGLRPMQSPLRRAVSNDDGALNEPVALPAKWETEQVDRYASGLIKPTYIEHKNSDGTIVRKPAVEVVPLESGERPASPESNSNGMGVVSLANYDSLQGDAKK